MQLDALLRSIGRHAPDLYNSVTVLYRADTDTHTLSYLDCLTVYKDRIAAVHQGDFEDDVREWLAKAGAHVAFHCDDDVFYRDAPKASVPLGSVVAWTLRLGHNTNRCHPLACEQPVPPRMRWRWADYYQHGDFGYPFSLNATVYRTRDVRSLLAGMSFTGPNDLEHRGYTRMVADTIDHRDVMDAPEHSCVVSIPANRVNDGYPNPASDDPETQADRLCERFHAGERIDLDAMDFSNVDGAHADIALRFSA